MNIYRDLMILVILYGVTVTVCAGDLTDNDAKRLAIDLERVVSATRTNLNALIQSGDKRSYHRTMGPLLAKMSSWPEMHLGNRASFPYFYCRDAGSAMMMYGDAWYRGDPSVTWREYSVDKFRRSHAECKRALVKPDMSLKDIQ